MVLKCLFEKTRGLRPKIQCQLFKAPGEKNHHNLETDKSLSSSMTLGRLVYLKTVSEQWDYKKAGHGKDYGLFQLEWSPKGSSERIILLLF